MHTLYGGGSIDTPPNRKIPDLNMPVPVEQKESHAKTEPDTDEGQFLDWVGEHFINNFQTLKNDISR
jgi:hypothetical protein